MTDWTEILSNHGGIAWKTIRRLIDDDADAKDCFQEVFVAALEFTRTRTVRNWPGFLKRLATARSLDVLRKRRRKTVLPLNVDSIDEPPCPLGSPISTAEANELFDQLRDALAVMPVDQAEACCLRHLESFTYEQIADELGVTVNHVGVLLHRARALLQVKLAKFAPSSHQAEEINQ